MKKSTLVMLATLFLLNSTTAQIKPGIATQRISLNIRGKVVTNQYGANTPLKLAKVDLYYDIPGKGWTKVQSTITDSYGYYYFKDVQPSFALQVNNSKNYNISLPNPNLKNTYQDIPPIVLNIQRVVRRY